MNSDPDITRVFIVGCPRSGTTLLQSLLAAHPEIVSFPESHFFNLLRSDGLTERLRDLTRSQMRAHLEDYFAQMGHPKLAERARRFKLTERGYIGAFVDCLDELARDAGASMWLEKTPSHLVRIPLIERHVPTARFIHIVRRGVDVVASLYKVTQDYPEAWGGARSIDTCINRWLTDVERTESHLDKPHHTLVQYERLLAEPERELARLCEFLGVEFRESMLVDYRDTSHQVVAEGEDWKHRNSGPLRKPNSKKFETVFDEDERLHILKRLRQATQRWPVGG
ncbi:MAG: sulfotransferase family protein [Persicimonas sp.]